MECNIGSEETVGVRIGEKMDFSESECISLTSALRRTVHGELWITSLTGWRKCLSDWMALYCLEFFKSGLIMVRNF